MRIHTVPSIILMINLLIPTHGFGKNSDNTNKIANPKSATQSLKVKKEEKQVEPPDDKDLYQRGRMAFLFGYFDTAYVLWKPLAYKGFPDAEASLGWMYYTGNGRKKDYKLAFKWFKKAARQQHPIAQNNLGVMYEMGLGVNKNKVTAQQWYRESAEWGYSYGQFNMGKSLLEASPSKVDKKEAIYWLDLSALQGVSQAKALLENTLHEHTHPLKKMMQDFTIQQDDWLLKQNPEFYTVQLFATHDKKFLVDFIRHNDLSGAVAYFNSGKAQGESQYSLIYGKFSSYQNANIALKSLPSNLLENKPKILKYREIQAFLNPAKLKFPGLQKTH